MEGEQAGAVGRPTLREPAAHVGAEGGPLPQAPPEADDRTVTDPAPPRSTRSTTCSHRCVCVCRVSCRVCVCVVCVVCVRVRVSCVVVCVTRVGPAGAVQGAAGGDGEDPHGELVGRRPRTDPGRSPLEPRTRRLRTQEIVRACVVRCVRCVRCVSCRVVSCRALMVGCVGSWSTCGSCTRGRRRTF